MDLQELERLMEDCGRAELAFAQNYPSLAPRPAPARAPAPPRPAAPAHIQTPAPPAAPPELANPANSAEDLQFYALRRKFGAVPPDPDRETRLRAGAPPPLRGERAPADLPAGELALTARTALNRGQLTDEGRTAAALQAEYSRVPDPAMRWFLQGMISVQQQASRKGLESLLRELPAEPGADPVAYGLYAVQCCIRFALALADGRERTRDRAARARQQELDAEQAAAQRKVDEAHRAVLNTPRF